MKLAPVTTKPAAVAAPTAAPKWLELKQLGTLTTDGSTGPGRQPHVSAASGLVVVGRSVWVASDDENHLARFDALGAAKGQWLRALPGTLPAEKEARRAEKPDFETLSAFPATATAPHGGLLSLGSGSADTRLRGVFVPLDVAGAPQTPRTVDLSQLLGSLSKQIDDLNIEGSVVSRGLLRLFHRGGENGGNAIIDVDLSAVTKAIDSGTPLDASALRGTTPFDLGTLAGIPLGFSDASALPDGSIVFVASAEDTDDPVFDGAVSGSVIGLLRPDGSLGPTFPVKNLKLEGVDARVVGDDLELLLVADADDPNIASPLLSVRLPGLAPAQHSLPHDESGFDDRPRLQTADVTSAAFVSTVQAAGTSLGWSAEASKDEAPTPPVTSSST